MSNSAPPFSLTLELRGLTLRALLTNRTSQPRPYFHDLRRQPVLLRLRAPGGRAVPVNDQREIQKFDATVYPEDFVTLDPQASAVLFEATFVRAGGLYSLGVGPFQWGELAPGRYTADARLDHRTASAFDPRTSRAVPVAGLWTGTLRAPAIPVALD